MKWCDKKTHEAAIAAIRDCDFAAMTPDDWAKTGDDTLSWFLFNMPSLFETYGQWMRMTEKTWVNLLLAAPRYGKEWESAPWSGFDNRQWLVLLSVHPDLAARCPDLQTRFDECEWVALLLHEPQMWPACPFSIDFIAMLTRHPLYDFLFDFADKWIVDPELEVKSFAQNAAFLCEHSTAPWRRADKQNKTDGIIVHKKRRRRGSAPTTCDRQLPDTKSDQPLNNSQNNHKE